MIPESEVPTDAEVRDAAFVSWFAAACSIEPTPSNMATLASTMPNTRACRCAWNGLRNRVPFWLETPDWIQVNGAQWLKDNPHGGIPWLTYGVWHG
jgi:hypothetical protein